MSQDARTKAIEELLALSVALLIKSGALYEQLATDEIAKLADKFGAEGSPEAAAIVTRVLQAVHAKGEGLAWIEPEGGA